MAPAAISWTTSTEGEITWRLTASAYVSPETQYATVQWKAADGLPADWSGYDTLEIDCKQAGDAPMRLSLRITDAAGVNAYTMSLVLNDDQWRTVTLPIPKFKIDRSNVQSLYVSLSRPGWPVDIEFRRPRLTCSLPDRLFQQLIDFVTCGDIPNAIAAYQAMDASQQPDAPLATLEAQADQLDLTLRAAVVAHMRSQSTQTFGAAGYAVGVTDSMRKIYPKDVAPSGVGTQAALSLAKNEAEALQVLVVAPESSGLAGVSVTATDLVNDANPAVVLPASAVSIAPVGFVDTVASRFMPQRYVGWSPDPLLSFMTAVDVAANEVQPFWVRVRTNASTQAGTYHGVLHVAAAGQPTVDVPFNVTVWDFALPVRSSLPTATSIYGYPYLSSARKQDLRLWLLDNFRYTASEIYNGGAYTPTTPTPASTFASLYAHGLTGCNMLYLPLPRQVLHEQVDGSKLSWSQLPFSQRSTYPADGVTRVLDGLTTALPQFQANSDLWPIAYCYGFDEAEPSEWPAIADLLAQVQAQFGAGAVRVISTAEDPSYGTASVLGDWIDTWIPHCNSYNYALAEQVRAVGHKVWWYDTNCTIDNTAVSIRAMTGVESFRMNVDGFLYWTLNRWNNNPTPITSGPYTTWNPESDAGWNSYGELIARGPGDSFLSTIRLENLRDGLEDYEYFHTLSQLLAEHEAALPAAVVQQAQNALAIATVASEHPTINTYTPGQLAAARQAIAQAIESIQAALAGG